MPISDAPQPEAKPRGHADRQLTLIQELEALHALHRECGRFARTVLRSHLSLIAQEVALHGLRRLLLLITALTSKLRSRSAGAVAPGLKATGPA